jgi:hypothetical protein
MTADLHIDYDVHLRSGRVWRVELQLPLQNAPDDAPNFIDVSVDVVAPNRELAQYIAATIYPEYLSLCIDYEPISGPDSAVQA